LDGQQFEQLYTGEKSAEDIENDVMEKEAEIKKVNAQEAEESEKLRREAEERLMEEIERLRNQYVSADGTTHRRDEE
ncbi:MAG: zinc metalloprotease, partial [[Eubacterium] sulci]|nr:zinc metalloprotease [[Eubacterium] sulci]